MGVTSYGPSNRISRNICHISVRVFSLYGCQTNFNGTASAWLPREQNT